ncbi:putative glucuronyltransferase I [Operophtera brumata]|uniref:Galactosylgalactosylxylosylprotein 3-beta-glucuronosyltransferase n=1 Tax=Operophtera brumata TaxID=104452 RepID=A0A0L7L7J4_OPEBR|nr:putative glucuronyltransferase I [Operophtera brumata]
MPFLNIKKQYLAVGMLIFVVLFLFNSRPAFQCQFNQEVNSFLPTIYGITPTYSRLAQKADLTSSKTKLVENLLKESTLKYTHLNIKTHKAKHSTASGVEQRNLALDWLREHIKAAEDKRGVVYFMDDDNTYSLKMRKINKVGVWPVGIVGGMRVEMPLVTDGKVTGYNAVWKPFRPFPIDMAGFAINATLFLDHPDAKFSRKVQSGFQESEILKYMTKTEDLEPLADNCTKVYVWHTRTQKTTISNPKKSKVPPIPDEHIEV